MEYFAAALFGIATTCFVFVASHYYQRSALIRHRLSEAPATVSPFPFKMDSESHDKLLSDEEITLDDAVKDKNSRGLFLAGLRYRRHLQIFNTITKLSYFLPLFLFAWYGMDGSLQSKDLITIVAVGVGLFAGSRLFVRHYRLDRQKKIIRCMPQFLDLLVICLDAGLSFTSALERVIHEMSPDEPLTKEFTLMFHEYLGGLSIPEASRRLSARCDVTDLSILMNSIVQSEEMGASIGKTLKIQADEVRDKYRQRIRARALKVPVKILFPVSIIFVSLLSTTLGPSLYRVMASWKQATHNENKKQESNQQWMSPSKSNRAAKY